MFICTNNSNHKYNTNTVDGFCPESACYGIGYLVEEKNLVGLTLVDLTQNVTTSITPPPIASSNLSKSPRAVMLLAPIVPQQKNQYKLYVQSNGLFGGYIKVDGSLTVGKNPFDVQEISQGVGFNTMNNAIEWARENNLQVVNKGKVSEGNRGYAIASLVIGGFVLCFALTAVAADPNDAGLWSSMLIFFVLAGFLIVSGLSNIQKPK